MPKSNFCQPKTDERLDFLREAVDGGMSRNKIKVKELSVKTGINKSTLYKRRQKPETMTIGELLILLSSRKVTSRTISTYSVEKTNDHRILSRELLWQVCFLTRLH